MFMPALSSAFGLGTRAMEKVALKSVNVQATFKNLLCETTMRQVYRNLEEKPIEAVYTFPLASSAVLLGLKVTIGKRELEGKIVEKAQAEENYEEAITEGNTAIMLERNKHGLYTMNVGNILAGEEISITITYAELYTWQGNTLRFHLPTTIAPRYGNPEEAGLQPHQEPEYDLLAENRFQIKLTLSGSLASAQLECPSHKISIAASPGETVATLAASEAFMDRDFILNIRMPEGGRDFVLLDKDFDGGYVALASFAPTLPMEGETQPKSVKIVVDCSGSMSGDSITQAKQAISDILKQLRPTDYFNLLAFGSTVTAVFSRQVKANKNNLTKVRRILRSIDANMGGTEMHRALLATVEVPGPEILQDILLITDGQVWKSDEIISMVKEYKHRVFTVGVGSAVSEEFVRRLSTESGGACELVSPNEKMAEKIVRHFKRIYLPRATKVKIKWPSKPGITYPQTLGPVYDGDTLHTFAFFNKKPKGDIALDMTLEDGRKFKQSVTIKEADFRTDDNAPGSLTRMAVNQSLAIDGNEKAATMAVKYQLISPLTNYLVIEDREENKEGQSLPELRKVPQMIATGWSGAGSVCARSSSWVNKFQRIPGRNLPRKHLDIAPDPLIAEDNEILKLFMLIRTVIMREDGIDNISNAVKQILPKKTINKLKSYFPYVSTKITENEFIILILHALSHADICRLYFRFEPRVKLITLIKQIYSSEKIVKKMCLDAKNIQFNELIYSKTKLPSKK